MAIKTTGGGAKIEADRKATARADAIRVSRENDAALYARGHNTWLYRVSYPAGGKGWWVRFSDTAERFVDGCDLTPVEAFRNGQQVWPIDGR